MGRKKIIMLFLVCVLAHCSSNSKDSGSDETAYIPPEGTFSLSQYGITWYFDREYQTGQFVNGDWWVEGPVRIIATSPGSVRLNNGRIINGSMLNPAINFFQGYDSWMLGSENRNWDTGLNAGRPGGEMLSDTNPLTIESGSLVSSISYPDLRTAMNVRVMAVLTILESEPESDAFRPPYVGTDKSIRHTASQCEERIGNLPALVCPEDTPDIAASLARFEKPWVEHIRGSLKEIFCAPDNMPNYGREIAWQVSEAACMLTLDVDQAQKRLLAIRMIQLGLDCYGILQEENGTVSWIADGGHMSGRSFPFVFAGYMLGDAAMLGVMQKTGHYAYENGHYEGNLPDDYVHFGEIDQTFYVTQRDIDRTAGGVVPGVWEPDNRAAAIPYSVTDRDLAEWGICHAVAPSADNKNWEATYRYTCALTWSGFILAARILGISDLWNHQPLFDYVDRWMDQQPAVDDFQQEMWDACRPAY